MTTATTNRLKPHFLQGRRLLLTAFVIPTDEYYYEPIEGWLEPVEVAMYSWHLGCSLAWATGERRYIDSYGRDEVLWSSNSILQNMQLRPELCYVGPNNMDLNRLESVIMRFISGCKGMYRSNHPVVTLGAALLPAQGLQLYDPASGLAVSPLSTQSRVMVQTSMEADSSAVVVHEVLDRLRDGLTNSTE